MIISIVKELVEKVTYYNIILNIKDKIIPCKCRTIVYVSQDRCKDTAERGNRLSRLAVGPQGVVSWRLDNALVLSVRHYPLGLLAISVWFRSMRRPKLSSPICCCVHRCFLSNEMLCNETNVFSYGLIHART